MFESGHATGLAKKDSTQEEEKITHPDLSMVVLCYQAGEKIHNFLSKLIASVDPITSSWEIVLVGNYWPGMSDPTPKIIQEIAAHNPKIRAVAKPKEGWMGWDARTGLDACQGEVIALVDGDEQILAEDITRAYQLLRSSQADVVKSFRQARHDPWIRHVNSFLYNFLYNLMFPGYYVRDVNSKPKLFRKAAFKQLRLESKDWFLDAEMMIQARRLRLKLVEFPTVFHKASYRKSFVRVSAVFEFLKNLAIARFREFRATSRQ